MNTSVGLKIGSLDLRENLERIEFAESTDDLDVLTASFVVEHDEVHKQFTKVKPGSEFTVELLQDESVVGKATGYVVEVEVEMVSSRMFRISITGLEGLVKMRGSPAEVTWEDAPEKIVKAIATNAKLSADAEASNVTAYRADQGDMDDAAFLKELASRFHYRVGFADGKVIFKRRSTTEAKLTVDWTEDVLAARTRASLYELATEVTVQGYDPKQNGWFVETVKDVGKGISGGDLGTKFAKDLYKALPVEVQDRGCTTPGAAQERAKAELKRRAERFIDGTIVLRGNPKARVGRDIQVTDGVWPFTGPYRILQARHVDEKGLGYRTYVDIHSDSLPKKP